MAAPKAEGVERKIVRDVVPEVAPGVVPGVVPDIASKMDAPVDLAAIREQIKRAVGNSAVTMVNSAMKEANEGRFLAMKLLFELIGLYPAAGGEESMVEDSMAKTLLRCLQLPEESDLEPFVTKDYELDTTTTTSNTVK
jgi:hypothetical protein